jgi:hypothetical protein
MRLIKSYDTSTGDSCGVKSLGKSEGKGPQRLYLSISKGVSATVSANVSISKGIISSGVGFDVTKSYTVTHASFYNVPKGKYAVLEGFPLYTVKNFNIYKDVSGPDKKIGYGSAGKPTGVCFVHYFR